MDLIDTLYKDTKLKNNNYKYNYTVAKYQRKFFLFAQKRNDGYTKILVIKEKKPLKYAEQYGFCFQDFIKESLKTKDILQAIKDLNTSDIIVDNRGYSLEELRKLAY